MAATPYVVNYMAESKPIKIALAAHNSVFKIRLTYLP